MSSGCELLFIEQLLAGQVRIIFALLFVLGHKCDRKAYNFYVLSVLDQRTISVGRMYVFVRFREALNVMSATSFFFTVMQKISMRNVF